MSKYIKISSITVVIFILFFILPQSSFAGNNDSLPSYGYSGKGDDKWKYNSNYSGMRISFYWAPDEVSFNTGEGVIQVGNTTDVSKTGPWYKVDRYTVYSIFLSNGDGPSYSFSICHLVCYYDQRTFFISYWRKYVWERNALLFILSMSDSLAGVNCTPLRKENVDFTVP